VIIPLKRYWNLLKSYLRPHKPRVILLAFAVSIGIALQLLTPQMLRRFVDSAVTKAEPEVLVQIAVVYILAAVSAQFFSSWGKYVGEDVGWKATNQVRADLTWHCLSLDLSFHKTRTPGEMIERIDGDCSALGNFFSQFMVGVLANTALLAGILALLFRVDWRVGVALTVFARQVQAEFYGFVGERLSGTEDIRANGAGHYVLRGFHELLRRWYPLARRAGIAGYSLWLASIILFALGTALSLSLGGYLYRNGSITIGTVCLICVFLLRGQRGDHPPERELSGAAGTDSRPPRADGQRQDHHRQTALPALRSHEWFYRPRWGGGPGHSPGRAQAPGGARRAA
jgi:ATP-binding cassette subfamily B protein